MTDGRSLRESTQFDFETSHAESTSERASLLKVFPKIALSNSHSLQEPPSLEKQRGSSVSPEAASRYDTEPDEFDTHVKFCILGARNVIPRIAPDDGSARNSRTKRGP